VEAGVAAAKEAAAEAKLAAIEAEAEAKRQTEKAREKKRLAEEQQQEQKVADPVDAKFEAYCKEHGLDDDDEEGEATTRPINDNSTLSVKLVLGANGTISATIDAMPAEKSAAKKEGPDWLAEKIARKCATIEVDPDLDIAALRAKAQGAKMSDEEKKARGLLYDTSKASAVRDEEEEDDDGEADFMGGDPFEGL